MPTDDGTGDVYYYSAATGETTWDRPSAPPAPPPPPPAVDLEPPPAGFEFAIGTRVEVFGLAMKPELNGRLGTVRGF